METCFLPQAVESPTSISNQYGMPGIGKPICWFRKTEA